MQIKKDDCGTPSPHGWTLDTLEEHLSSKISGVKEFFLAESRASKEAVSAALAAVKEQSAGAMVSAEKAIGKAELATEKRFDSVNEFRQTLSDQAANFLSRNEYSANHRAIEEKLAGLMIRLTNAEATSVAKHEGISSIGVFVLGAFVIFSSLANVASLIFGVMKH